MTKRTEQLIEALEENDRLRAIVASLMGEMTEAVKGAYAESYDRGEQVDIVDIAETYLMTDLQELAIECCEESDEDDAPLDHSEAA